MDRQEFVRYAWHVHLIEILNGNKSLIRMFRTVNDVTLNFSKNISEMWVGENLNGYYDRILLLFDRRIT